MRFHSRQVAIALTSWATLAFEGIVTDGSPLMVDIFQHITIMMGVVQRLLIGCFSSLVINGIRLFFARLIPQRRPPLLCDLCRASKPARPWMWNLGPSGFTSSSSLAHSHHSADNDRPIIKSLKVLSDHGISAPLLGPSDYLNVVVADREKSIAKRLKSFPAMVVQVLRLAHPIIPTSWVKTLSTTPLSPSANYPLAFSSHRISCLPPARTPQRLSLLDFLTSWNLVTLNLVLIALSLSAAHSAVSFKFSTRIPQMVFFLPPALAL